MESRRRTRRRTDEPAPIDADATTSDPDELAPRPLFEADDDEVDAPEQDEDVRARGDDLVDPGVVVTHSTRTQPVPEEEPVPQPETRLPQPETETEEVDAGAASAEAPQVETPAAPIADEESTVPEAAGDDEFEPAARSVAEAAAGGPDPGGSTRDTRFSGDGEWWWNGAGWLPAVSHDGLWRWDGARWQLQVASGLEPERLVDGLTQLAEVRYRRRGLLLVQRSGDWPVPPALGQVVDEAADILEQRVATERRLRELDGPGAGGAQRRMGGLLGRGSADDDRRRLRDELENMRLHLEPRLLRLGHEAPVPAFRDADEVLETARHLSDSADEVAAANDAVLGAQAEWQARVAAAQADLDERIAEREARIAEAEVEIRDAEARREHRIANAWRDLAEVRMPGQGDHLASFGPIHLFEARLEMPNAAGPTAGARAVIGSAAELTAAEPGALEDLFLVGDSGAADLHWAESNNDPTPYLLVVTESGNALVTCGESEAEARRFAHEVMGAAAAAAAAREERRTRVAEAYAAVKQAEQDRSEIEAAEDRKAAVEQDPDLLGAIAEARQRLSDERNETTEIDETGSVLQAVLDRLTTAPEPLPTVTRD